MKISNFLKETIRQDRNIKPLPILRAQMHTRATVVTIYFFVEKNYVL